MPWVLPVGREAGREAGTSHRSLDPTLLTLTTAPNIYSPSVPAAALVAEPENPGASLGQEHSATLPSSPPPPPPPPPQSEPPPLSAPPPLPSSSPAAMAFQRSDPGPFTPRHLRCIEVENRVPVVRAVASSRPPPQNENLASSTSIISRVMSFTLLRLMRCLGSSLCRGGYISLKSNQLLWVRL